MKKFLFLVIVFLGFINVFGQNLNIARHNRMDRVTNLICINSKSYFAEYFGDCCNDSVNFVGLASNGQTLFKTNIISFHGPNNMPKKLLKTKDKGFLLWGRVEGGCDVSPTYDYITKFDTVGNIVFQYTICGQNNMNCIIIEDISEGTDSAFYAVQTYSNALYRYTKLGVFTSSVSIAFTQLKSIGSLSNGNLIISGSSNSVSSVAEITTGGSVVMIKNYPNDVKSFVQTSNGRILALNDIGTMQTFSNNLDAILCSTTTIPASIKINELKLRSDTVYAVGTNTIANTVCYLVTDLNFNVIYQSQTSFKNVEPAGIDINNGGKVNIITKGSSNIHTKLSFRSLYQLPVNGIFNSKYDVGVMSFSVITASVAVGWQGTWTPTLNLNVIVKNYGIDTVKSFYLNYYAYTNPGVVCPNIYHNLFNITIAPGGTISVITGTFLGREMFPPEMANWPQGTIKKKEYCLTTTVPNFENDIAIDNDSFCDSVGFYKPVGIRENSLTESSIKISPNPFEITLSIESDLEIKKVELYNAIGMLVEKTIVNSKKIKLDYAELSPGIYFLKIEMEEGIGIKKIIKQ